MPDRDGHRVLTPVDATATKGPGSRASSLIAPAAVIATGLALFLASGCECGTGLLVDDAGPGRDASADAGGGAGVDAGSDAGQPDAGCLMRCGPSNVCCGDNEECVADRCLPRCEGSRCADDTVCCTGEELCIGMMCVVPGDPCEMDRDCPEDYACEPLVRRCVPIPPDSVCRYVPPSGVFDPEVQWSWNEEGSLALPLVLQLTDDNGDSVIDSADVPDVVAVTYPSSPNNARLTALSGDDGHVLWQSLLADPICGGASPAAGDLDGDGTVEIVVLLSASGSCGGGSSQYLAAFSHTGTIEWRSSTAVGSRYGAIAIADLEGDGSPEVVGAGSVFDAAGTFLWSNAALNDILGGLGANAPTIADVDLDGRMEVIASNVVFNDDGSVLWSGGSVARGQTAVARVIDTPSSAGPQVIAVNPTTFEILDGATGATLFGPITYETGGVLAGPPTVADFDADGHAEVGVAGDDRYVVFDPDLPAPSIAWSVPSLDSSTGSVGSTVFDFDADGSAEVIYNDECHLRILSGMDGSVIWSTTNTSVTALELPVVADVDADGNAEIVVVSNSYAGNCSARGLPFTGATQGVTVFRDRLDNWVATRSIWNQHAYHLDNVTDNGRIPMTEPRGWMTHNSYRLNALDTALLTLAPDLVVVSSEANPTGCPARAVLRARVENRGSRGVAAGVEVAFFAGDPPDRSQRLGVGVTNEILLAGAATWVEIEVTDPPFDAMSMLRFYAVVDDDGAGEGAHSECDEANNVGSPVMFDCSGPI